MSLRNYLKRIIPFPTHGDRLNEYKQMESLLAVYNLINFGYSLGPLRGWAISPDNLLFILRRIGDHPNPVILEFGSGQSTLAIAQLLAKSSGRLYSVEHNAEYHAEVRHQLERHGTAHLVHSIITPLVTDGSGNITYDLSKLPDVTPNIVIVDGPPGGGNSRLAPLLSSFEKMADDGVIFLDDYARDYEQRCVTALVKQFSAAAVESKCTEKGLAEIRRK